MMDTWPMILEKGEKIYVGQWSNDSFQMLNRYGKPLLLGFVHALFPKYHSKIPETFLHFTSNRGLCIRRVEKA